MLQETFNSTDLFSFFFLFTSHKGKNSIVFAFGQGCSEEGKRRNQIGLHAYVVLQTLLFTCYALIMYCIWSGGCQIAGSQTRLYAWRCSADLWCLCCFTWVMARLCNTNTVLQFALKAFASGSVTKLCWTWVEFTQKYVARAALICNTSRGAHIQEDNKIIKMEALHKNGGTRAKIETERWTSDKKRIENTTRTLGRNDKLTSCVITDSLPMWH